MELIEQAADFFIHLDEHLDAIIQQYGVWTYAILFLIVFCETGLVVTPLLPGDSLLFAVGTFAATGSFDVTLISITLIVAAILGDAVNYSCGAYIGPKVFSPKYSRWFKPAHLERTQKFYERHGGKTIILARFVPIVRTFAPFVAGVGKMPYSKFFFYNVTGAIAWVLIFVVAGYLFGNIPFVRDNFAFVALGIVAVSLLPMVYEWLKARRERMQATAEAAGS
jgi:membrane-associated protein